jgi:hypothetical protein
MSRIWTPAWFSGRTSSALTLPTVCRDKRTTRHRGYAASQRIRKQIEKAFGWIKTVAGLHQVKLRGLAKADWAFPSPRRLRSGAGARADRRGAMTGSATANLSGRWRIVEADLWDRD